MTKQVIDAIEEILDIIWGSPEPKKKRKQPRDKKGRFVRRKK
tara:strand:- start:1716 stop:1841 length:126 start_codon:yes stop_codon:yes gene_type:complete